MFALILSVFVVIFIGYQIWWSDSKALQNVDLMSAMPTDAVRPTRSAIELPRTAPARSWSEQIAEEKPLLQFLAEEKGVADLAEGGYFGAKDILERRERAEKLTQEEKDILERAGARGPRSSRSAASREGDRPRSRRRIAAARSPFASASDFREINLPHLPTP